MHHQLSNIHKLIFSAWNTNSGDIFTYSTHFLLKLTEQGCRPQGVGREKATTCPLQHVIIAHCRVWSGSHPTLSSLRQSVTALGFGLLLQDHLWRGKPVLGVLGGSLASFFSSLSVHPRLVAVGGPGQCPHFVLLEGEVAAGRSISPSGSLLGQQTFHVHEERSGRSTAITRQGRAFCLQLHVSEWTSHGFREASLPPAKVVSDWQSF